MIYDATSIGVPVWGEVGAITNNVRHYEVSEYVLRGWTPVLRTHGVLVMARNDLVASRPVPALSTPPQTTDLYFSGPHPADGGRPRTTCRCPTVRAPSPCRCARRCRGPSCTITGWAVDPATNLPASTVLIADGDRVVGTVTPTIDRPDVAQAPAPAHVGERLRIQDAMFDAAPDHPAVYSVGADGLAHPLGGSPAGPVAALRLPDGSQVRVAPTAGGCVGPYQADVYTVGELQLPSGIDLRDYDLATLSSTGGLGGANVALTDQFLHEISASWLDQAGSSLTLRVGSCPQWYGYDPSKPLYVMQSGGPPVTSVTLSSARRS